MPKVSIIVPIYNVMNQLQKCLISIMNQTFEDFEVLLLNDGSTDESGEIAKKFSKNNSKITYVEHKNMGLGPTRNRGIELAKGDYLMFVDSDDFLEVDAVKNLYESIIKYNSDVACGNLRFYFDNEKLNYFNGYIEENKFVDLTNMSLRNFSKEYYLSRVYSYNAVDKMYRKEFIKKHNIVFGDNRMVFAEDNYFQIQIILKRPTISFTNKLVYNYYQRSNSIMNSFKPNLIERQMNMISILDEMNNNKRDEFFTYILAPLAFETIIMEALNLKNESNRLEQYVKSMEKLRSIQLYSESIEIILKNNVYTIYTGISKKFFIGITAILEKNHLVKLSNYLVTSIYFK
ncbi:hypothetical protein NUITMVRA1_16380 [Aerococcus viridans]|uniref:glycosyltransferase family 2 protein n=1 Tax=Aerococcus viridans TaxID=1377 RepID=UPI0028FD00C6|nr:hypothetical protein NUITMVRA1_16380 [Aerococcus viridans]